MGTKLNLTKICRQNKFDQEGSVADLRESGMGAQDAEAFASFQINDFLIFRGLTTDDFELILDDKQVDRLGVAGGDFTVKV